MASKPSANGKFSSNGHVAQNGARTDYPYPGVPTTADGSGTVSWVETNITQGACAFPITPTTTMGGAYGAATANGATNLWGEPLMFLEPESEHSAATACEGFAVAGGRISNFTSGQPTIAKVWTSRTWPPETTGWPHKPKNEDWSMKS
jgi:hypothetical protein